MGFRLFLDKVHNALYLCITDHDPMQALKLRGSGRQKQHVAFTEKLIGTHSIQNGARIYSGSNLIRHTCGEIGLDDSRQDIHRRTLRGNDQMNACGPCHLRQPGQRVFHTFGCDHHKVGQLIDQDNNVREFSRRFRQNPLVLLLFGHCGFDPFVGLLAFFQFLVIFFL